MCIRDSVDVVKGLVVRQLAFLRQAVLVRLGDHGIHGNGGFPGGAVPNAPKKNISV